MEDQLFLTLFKKEIAKVTEVGTLKERSSNSLEVMICFLLVLFPIRKELKKVHCSDF